MNVMSLDLELNQPSNSIIQIGIVIGSTESGAILEQKYWNIFIDEEINPYITTLTGITQDMVNNGIFISDAYKEMTELYNKHNCSLNMVTWGGGDHRALQQQLKKFCDINDISDIKWEYGHREFDVKTLFLSFALAQGMKTRSGLAKSMTRVGLNFEGTKHWAVDDAHNTFRLLIFLLKKLPKNVIIK